MQITRESGFVIWNSLEFVADARKEMAAYILRISCESTNVLI